MWGDVIANFKIVYKVKVKDSIDKLIARGEIVAESNRQGIGELTVGKRFDINENNGKRIIAWWEVKLDTTGEI